MEIVFDEEKFVKNPFLSICIITYNHEKYIAKAIEGALFQKTDFSFEIIIAEDFSSDNTRSIIQGYQQKYPNLIKLLLQEKNVGASQNWKDLITTPSSKYIAYFEADDYWVDNYKLQRQVAFLESHEDYGACFTDFDILHDDSKKTIRSYNKSKSKVVFSGDVMQRLIYLNPYVTCTSLIKRIDFTDFFLIMENDRLPIGDWSLWLYISHQFKIGYLAHSTATYRVLNESASHSNNIVKKFIWHKKIFYVRNAFEKRFNIKISKTQKMMLYIKTIYSIFFDYFRMILGIG